MSASAKGRLSSARKEGRARGGHDQRRRAMRCLFSRLAHGRERRAGLWGEAEVSWLRKSVKGWPMVDGGGVIFGNQLSGDEWAVCGVDRRCLGVNLIRSGERCRGDFEESGVARQRGRVALARGSGRRQNVAFMPSDQREPKSARPRSWAWAGVLGLATSVSS